MHSTTYKITTPEKEMLFKINIIIAYESLPTYDFEKIMKLVLETGIEGNHNNRNIVIVLWMYDSE